MGNSDSVINDGLAMVNKGQIYTEANLARGCSTRKNMKEQVHDNQQPVFGESGHQ